MGIQFPADDRVNSLADLAVEIVSAFLAKLNHSEVGLLINAGFQSILRILPQVKRVLLQVVKPRSLRKLSGRNAHDPGIVSRINLSPESCVQRTVSIWEVLFPEFLSDRRHDSNK